MQVSSLLFPGRSGVFCVIALAAVTAAGPARTAPAAAPAGPAPDSSFQIQKSTMASSIYCPETKVRAEFWPLIGRFWVTGPGAGALQWSYLRFRANGLIYSFPLGLTVENSAINSGHDAHGDFAEISVLWQVRDRTHTPIRTDVRLYRNLEGALFEQSYPAGARGISAGDFQDVGCSFPTFDAPAAVPGGLRWMSYTYQDWPIPIRGSGWPGILPHDQWPATGNDDHIRTPLVFFDPQGHCDVLSPVDHGLQQITALAEPTDTGHWSVIIGQKAQPARPGSFLVASNPARGATPPGAAGGTSPPAAASAPTFGTASNGPPSAGGAPATDPVSNREDAPAGIKTAAPPIIPRPVSAPLGAKSPLQPDPGSGAQNPAPTAATPPTATPVTGTRAADGAAGTPPAGTPAASAASVPLPGAGSTAAPGETPALDTLAIPPAMPRTDDRLPALLVGAEGKLKALPAGAAFHAVLSFGQSGIADALRDWGQFLQQYNGKDARKAPADFTTHTLGYWTDNGAAYYYRTEGNAGYQATMQAVRAYHLENQIPVRYYQLDSWWYPKGRDGGTLVWSPKSSMLPQGVPGIARILDSPLALHNRYWSAATPYLKEGGFEKGRGASVPLEESFYEGIFRTAAGWGCKLYEQDWLNTQFQRVDSLQTEFGEPEKWLKAVDTAAAHYGLPIQFCMPSIGFYLASTSLPNVTQMRTSRDFSRDRPDSVHLRWMEHSQLSLLASVLGLAPSKDVLLTAKQGTTTAGSWEQTEALLAILSRGPVGIGDSFGHTDPKIIQRMTLEDGRLVQPDQPAIPVASSITGQADLEGLPLVLQTTSTMNGETWHYVLSMDLGDTRALGEHGMKPAPAPADEFQPATTALLEGLTGRYICYDAIRDRVVGIASVDQPVTLPDAFDSPKYVVLAPLLPDGTALIGDVSRFVTVSRERFGEAQPQEGGMAMRLEGPEGSVVRLAVYAPHARPTLEVNGRSILPETQPGLEVAFEPRRRPDPRGRRIPDAGADEFPPPDPYASALWHFSFRLPASSPANPVEAVLKS